LQRESAKQLQGAGQRNDSFHVGDFAALNFAILGFVIRVGKEFADRGDAGAAVGHSYNFVRIEPVFARPTRPDAGDSGCRIHKNAVQIKEHATKRYSIHDLS
jgi:hypothetical protein